jgi:hypothetical protein
MGPVQYLHNLLLGLWVGALVAFAAVFAPSLFQVLPSNEAAQVVRTVLPRLDLYALVAGPALVALGLYADFPPRGRSLVRIALLAAMVGLATANLFMVGPRLESLRAQAQGQVSALPREHPTRRAFGRLHGVSTGLKLGELALGLLTLALVPARRASR